MTAGIATKNAKGSKADGGRLVLSLAVSKEMFADIKNAAIASDLSMSAIGNIALRQYLAKRGIVHEPRTSLSSGGDHLFPDSSSNRPEPTNTK